MQFGRIAIDEQKRTVSLDGADQHLEPQAFDLLSYLVAHRDRVISKEELLDEVWGDQFVSESALTTRVKEVRQAVGDDGARQAAVKNFRGRGYRWVASETQHPAARSRLVGRDGTTSRIVDLLSASAVVTMVGPGGVGKTTLMVEAVGRLRERGTECIVVHLAGISEPSAVVAAIAFEMGLGADATDDAAALDEIAADGGILVLDNCEHLVARVAQVVDELTTRNPSLRVLATSRERLGVSGEQVVPIAPLTVGAGTQLLRQRSAEARPDFELSDSPNTIARLLRLVDHLPLGIEMIAPHVPVLGLEQLVGHLEAGAGVLRSPNRAAEARHRDLGSVVDWSLRLLTDDARSVVTEMSVFAGPVAVESVATVLGWSATDLALGPLAQLAEKSLIVTDNASTPATYGLLETVRAAVSTERDPRTDRRHAVMVADEARAIGARLLTPDEPEASLAFDALTREIRAAHGWAKDHDPDLARRLILASAVYAHERQWPEPAQWCAALVAGTATDDVDPMLASLLANDAANRGDFDTARRYVDQGLVSPVPAARASALDARASIGMYTGDLATTRTSGLEIRQLAEEVGDGYMWTLGHLDLVLGNVFEGRLAEAQALIDTIDPPAPLSPTSLAWVAYAAAELALAKGDGDEAIAGFERAIQIARPIGSRYVVTVCEVARLAAMARSGEPTKAMATFAPLIERYRHLHSTTHVVTAMRHVVVLFARAGRAASAMRILGALQALDRQPYGVESDLLEQACDAAADLHGSAAVEGWLTEGAGRDLAWAIELAADGLAAAQG